MKSRKPRKPHYREVYWIEINKISEDIQLENMFYSQWNSDYAMDGWVKMFCMLDNSEEMQIYCSSVMVF
jgi:hypothetical protein